MTALCPSAPCLCPLSSAPPRLPVSLAVSRVQCIFVPACHAGVCLPRPCHGPAMATMRYGRVEVAAVAKSVLGARKPQCMRAAHVSRPVSYTHCTKAAHGHSRVVHASWLVSHSVYFQMFASSSPLHPVAPSRPAIPSAKTTTNRMETDKIFFRTGCPGKKKVCADQLFVVLAGGMEGRDGATGWGRK